MGKCHVTHSVPLHQPIVASHVGCPTLVNLTLHMAPSSPSIWSSSTHVKHTTLVWEGWVQDKTRAYPSYKTLSFLQTPCLVLTALWTKMISSSTLGNPLHNLHITLIGLLCFSHTHTCPTLQATTQPYLPCPACTTCTRGLLPLLFHTLA